ncbi:MAG TPA: hypothetical protein VEA59_01535 [Patescibacteria group bacterium]|nr:hypothetical protein [Patescibacteria group bacterium]
MKLKVTPQADMEAQLQAWLVAHGFSVTDVDDHGILTCEIRRMPELHNQVKETILQSGYATNAQLAMHIEH